MTVAREAALALVAPKPGLGFSGVHYEPRDAPGFEQAAVIRCHAPCPFADATERTSWTDAARVEAYTAAVTPEPRAQTLFARMLETSLSYFFAK